MFQLEKMIFFEKTLNTRQLNVMGTKLSIFFLMCMVTGSSLFGQAAPDQSNKSKKPPKPSIVVSMEKKEIREKERLKVTLWISNDSWQDLTGVKLFISTPVYLK
jgi:hypothetical protein